MRGAADDRYRVVVDEGSLDWRGRADLDPADAVDDLADLLDPLTTGKQVALMDHAYEVECWESVRLFELFTTRDPRVPRDSRVRLATLLDKCHSVSPEDDDLPQEVEVGGTTAERSFGFCHVLALASAGRAMSCLVASPEVEIAGWTTVKRQTPPAELDIHLLTAPGQLPDFWRGVLRRERITETQFFALAGRAFPELLFADSLSFGRFKGAREEVIPWLIDLLSGINDSFASSLIRHQGDRKKVIKEFSTYGITISPDSTLTHKNPQAWAQRLVEFEGVRYRCEWHGKRVWNCDRVHFSLPIEKYSGRILVGIFAEHLD
ncbi:hypothetical protein GCM10027598_64660 [Amycolatopsis oliviviridis]|uniref:Uncharacterized protein n=1 Tax=Amycolatopsis oliviviridis TaxID=1471590 RepID=A0ABQ3M838_9PSEU|nr:hypothetical protein [Amycolatopsis oliviviridis]GHH36030.1 hypothetical protein GCM10017790_78270 [Amycolatopsis oliviviridis]